MTNSELMKAAISNGLADDGTTSAALDAIREESGCSLLAAVLEVARVHSAATNARDMKEATTYIAPGHALSAELKRLIVNECHGLPVGAVALILVVEGESHPQTARRFDRDETYLASTHLVSVGASWVKREASRLMLERERSARRPRRRRSC